ncbi:uncharacterized protein LOC132788799 isoform X6 [Drosophila nasuta]|uniref:uncharacterized protein LOC132788799 isoform X6 n=1 Tax=Drosophila nasuta TaxID=42062 RepID=UPI00295E8A88|nr:uncharacterized protein LOC132788799 isoform X6 [Drosophila nasuta]
MENIEIEYLDEYKDLVLPGINTNSDTPTTTTASLNNQAGSSASLSRSQGRRISSDTSGSSSIDPDIFQKLFDDKFMEDELLNESSTNVKDRSRHNSSSSSSGSNDALDALFNRQTHKAHGSKRRGRLESFDSLDDLGEVLMGSSHKLLLSKASSSSSRKSQSLHKVTSAVKSKSPDKVLKTYGQSHSASSPPFNARAAGSNINGNSSSSSSSNHQLQDNKTKKPVTIIEAQKPDLKPSKHEPKEDPLHLQDLPCDSDSDSSYVYESDFYGYDDSDEEDDSKQIIDISTDTSATPSVAETVSPVVSDDESQQAPESRQHHERDQQPLTPIGKNERLKVYLDNLSDAETPPSRHKHSRSPTKKSYANEQNQSDSQQVNDSSTGNIGQSMAGGEQQLEVASSSTITNPRRLFDDEGGGGDDSHNLPPADYVDNNLTYETLERLSLNLAEQISSIDAERSIEFEKRSGSKPRSKSISQPTSSSFFVSHVRKLTYSNEALDKAVIGRTNLRRAISEGPFPKGKRGRPPKKRTDTTEEQKSVISLTPKKQSDKNDLDISEGCKNNTHVVEPVSVLESAPEPVLMKASDPVTEPEPTTVTEPILKTITEPVPANVMEPVLPTVLEPVLMTVTEPVEEKLQPSKAVLELTPVKRKPGRPRKKKRIDKSRSKLPVSPELPKHKDAENKIVITNENSNFGKATQEIEILQVDTTDKEKICNSIGSDKNQNSSKTQKTEENLTAAIESITVMENFIRGSEMQTDLKDTNDNSKSEIDAIAKENLENLQETENPMEEVVNILEMATINSVKECDKETGDVQEPIETVTSINEEIKMPEVPEITSKDTINEESSKIIEETEQQVDVGANIELTEENMEKSHEEIELNEMHEADELVKEMAKICEGESLDQIVEEVIIRSEQEVTDDVNQLITPQGNEGNLTEVSNAPEDLGAAELCADNLPTQDIKTASKAIITCEKECSDGSKTITGRRSRSGKRTTKGEINLSAGESPMLTESKDHKFDAENKDTKVDSGDSATEHKRSNSKQKKSETSLKPVTNTTDKQKDNLSRNKKGRFRKRKVEMSEENQLNDFTLDSNNEDIKTVPQTTSATEGQPLNDSQTNIESPEPNSSNENSATENKALQTKRKSKSAKSTSKETKSEDSESNLDVSGKPIPLDLPSTSQEQTTGKTPSENLESIDFQENVASKVTSGKKNRKTLIIKRQPKKADILLSSDRHLGMSQNAAENLKVVNILTDLKFVVENIAESNILPEEKNQISETDELVKNLQGTQVATASDSMMKQLKPKEITDIQESEGRTTRSRAGTPAAAQRFKSREKETAPNTVGGSKTKHLMQAKTIMAPPTISHSKVSTGKSVMRRPFNAYEQSTPPAEKRRKVEIKARDKPKSSPATALHQVKGSSFVSPKKVSPVLNTKPEAFTSPSKSTLSSLLGGDETPTLSSSVVITKTTVGTSNEPFKRVASTSPAATSSGINISVSVVPDAITQPKKKLTQAETVKKMLSKAMQSSTVSKGDGKSLPANKPRKSEADKRSIQPVKTVVPLEEKSATLPLLGKKSLPQIETKKKAEKPQRKSMLSKIFDADPLPTEPSTSSQANVAAAAATLTIAKQEKKRPLQKEPKKSVGKAKTKDLEEVRQQLEKATAGPARSTSSPALSPAAVELVKGPAKRMPKKPPQKRDLSVARSLAESSVDRVVTSTSRESSGDRTKRTPRAPKASTISQATSSEPQRQPKKGQKVTTDVTQQALKHQQRLQQLQQEKIQKELQTNRLHLVEQTQPPKKQKQQQQQQQHEKPQGRKRKLPAVSGAEAPIVKRAKQQPEKPSTTSIAFPVRITAASSVSQSVMQPSALQPLPLRAKPIVKLPALRKARRLRVRLNRRVVNNWMKQQQATIEKQLQQMETPSQAIATPATAPVEATHATIAAPPVLPQLLSAASSLPTLPPSLPTVPPSLPALHRQPNLSTNVLPLPLVEVKTEEETVEEQQLQEVIRLLPADRLEAPLQVVAPIPRTVSDPVTPVSSSSIPITMPAHNNDNVVNSSGSVAEVPSASSSTDDVSTFGTTKMFSFLYPSRYKRSYGQVGLDFCCPNLNGPMQAIDPTRLHHKAEVPVLELPQYMVISTKIFSKQDKNIPQKVRAKLEQMAGKEGQPCVVQSVQISEPVAVAAPPVVPSAPPGPVLAPAAVPALAPIATSAPKPAPSPAAASSPASGLIERLTKPLSLSLPRSAILTKKTNPTAAAVAPNLSSSPPVVNTPSTAAVDPLANLLHMPPICPGDKQRVELQTRIQLFDLMLQNITKSVISMTVLERQRVVESFVRKSTLQPIDVEVGTKLLENYGYHLNAIVDNVSVPIPNLRPPVTLASTPAATPQVTSGSKKPSSSAVAAEVVSQPGDPADNYSRAIYDQSRNVIGYEYKKPRHSLVSPSSTPRNPQQQQTPPTAASIKPSAPTAGAGGGPSRVSKRVSSANTVSFQPSSRQKTYSRTANKLQMPQRTLENATPSSTQHAASTNVGASNRNLYIVNQVLSQPEECILPDGVGVPEDAEIKGEIDDVEILA